MRVFVLMIVIALAPPFVAQSDRLAEVRGEISRLEGELATLQKKERGVLGELDRLRSELALRRAEVEEVGVRLEQLEQGIETHDRQIGEIESAQASRREYLSFRLREVYKAGADQWLKRFVSGTGEKSWWRGMGYASYLSERDADVLKDFREATERSRDERAALEATRIELASAKAELERDRSTLETARRKHDRQLKSIQRDRAQRSAALGELQEAAEALDRLVDDLGDLGDRPAAADLDIGAFKGLLDWPADGPLGDRFGTQVHPQFGTEVPHPGWDIDAPAGSDVRTVFDGTVVFAEWMRGYGLTAIVDHGGNALSIYGHASALLVEPGDRVARGQRIGMVGETGSLRGPFLYFELRVDGRPVDPAGWLRGR